MSILGWVQAATRAAKLNGIQPPTLVLVAGSAGVHYRMAEGAEGTLPPPDYMGRRRAALFLSARRPHAGSAIINLVFAIAMDGVRHHNERAFQASSPKNFHRVASQRPFFLCM